MEQNYIEKEITGIKESNLERLKSIFPSIIKDGQVDFEELKNMLGEFEEVEKEKYEFTWCGKQKAKQTAISGIKGKTLKLIEEDSKNIDTTENLYIEGDNLEVLKLLRNNYANKIKMIYIDPPYNTGNDFVYNDSFKMSNEEVNENSGNTINGEKQANINKDEYSKNSKEESKYHSNWLNMMYPRLKLAQELLTEDGVIFISIDDNEQENLKKVSNEIFGENNFICNFIRKTGSTRAMAKNFDIRHDYVVIYAKNINNVKFNEIEKDSSGYKNYDNDKNGKWETQDFTVRTGGYNYEIPSIDLKERFSRNWAKKIEDVKLRMGGEATESFEEIYKRAIFIKEKGWYILGEFVFKGETNIINIKKYAEKTATLTNHTIYENVGSNKSGGLVVKNILDAENCFSMPKPIQLLEYLIFIGSNKDNIILDFFSGSATTAHACMKLNAEDGGNRKYIMVQLPEVCDEKSEAYKAGYKNICEIGKERIRRAGEQIKEELIKAGENEKAEKLDIGFKVLRLDDTNINWEKEENKANINKLILERALGETASRELVSDFVKGSRDKDVVYELMLRYYGVSLTEKIDKLTDIGNRTYSVCDTLIVCLENEITKEMIDKLSEIDFAKIYFRDSSFKGDNALELKENLMTRLQLQRKNKNNITYRVEFI